MPRRLFVLLIFVGLELAATARAQTAPAPAFDLPQLMARFSAVKSGTAYFTEEKYLHILKQPLHDNGVLIYEAPDKLQKQTLLPTPELLVVIGDTLTVDSRGKHQTLRLSDYPQLGGFIEGIRATLAGDLATLQKIYDVRLDGSLDDWHLELLPRDPKM